MPFLSFFAKDTDLLGIDKYHHSFERGRFSPSEAHSSPMATAPPHFLLPVASVFLLPTGIIGWPQPTPPQVVLRAIADFYPAWLAPTAASSN